MKKERSVILDSYEMEWEDFKFEMEAISDFENVFLVGNVQVWNGKHDTIKYIEDIDALISIIGEYDNVRFFQYGKELWLELIHHDGTHRLEIRPINYTGMEHVNRLLDYTNEIDDELLKITSRCKKNYSKRFFYGIK